MPPWIKDQMKRGDRFWFQVEPNEVKVHTCLLGSQGKVKGERKEWIRQDTWKKRSELKPKWIPVTRETRSWLLHMCKRWRTKKQRGAAGENRGREHWQHSPKNERNCRVKETWRWCMILQSCSEGRGMPRANLSRRQEWCVPNPNKWLARPVKGASSESPEQADALDK